MRILRSSYALRRTAIACVGAGLLAVFAGSARAEDDPLPPAITRAEWNVGSAPAAERGVGPASLGEVKHLSGRICGPTAGPGSDGRNVNTDCDESVGIVAPHNETSIAVNPTNPTNIVGGANDYQLVTTSGGTVKETILSRAHVTFDGGSTWSEYAVPFHSYVATGDPALAFDDAGTAYYATLGFLFSQGNAPGFTAPDVVVSHSNDGGRTWSVPTRVGQGAGSATSTTTRFLDKEYIAAWGDGNAIVTWTRFVQGPHGVYIKSPLYDSVTHDGGNTWTQPTPISGAAAFCLGSGGDNACDMDQVSVPVVAADGSIYVAFENFSDLATGRDQYLVVQVDPATGALVAGPFRVGTVVDGYTDYPFNIQGRQTYQDSEFRTWSAGNITADPTDPRRLAVVWSDMRNSVLPAPADPYAATTNSDVIVSLSTDRGRTWSAPRAIALPNDQFMPWGAYDRAGLLRVGHFDRSYDPANHMYGYSLATQTSRGATTFANAQVSTALSQPTMNDRWFSGFTVDPAFPNPTSFLGDYSNVARDPRGGVVAYWTDMRNTVCFTVRCGFGEDAFFARSP
jgi:hypothetical protein